MVLGHHIALFDNSMLLGQVLLCECLLNKSRISSHINEKRHYLQPEWKSKEKGKHTVSLDWSPNVFPISWLCHSSFLPLPLDWRPGMTRGMVENGGLKRLKLIVLELFTADLME
jgi:hypothetical protein